MVYFGVMNAGIHGGHGCRKRVGRADWNHPWM